MLLLIVWRVEVAVCRGYLTEAATVLYTPWETHNTVLVPVYRHAKGSEHAAVPNLPPYLTYLPTLPTPKARPPAPR